MRDFKRTEHKFDPQNPFTFCEKNNQITTENEHRLLGLGKPLQRAASSTDIIRKKTETIDRLYRNPKKEHRIGQFRSIKNQINERENDKEKELSLKNNIDKYKTEGNFFPKLNQTQSNKHLPLGDIINKPAKLSMKEYLGFKREIFLSRQNKDIKNESTKKLDDFIFYETKSQQQQVNDMGVDNAYVKSYFKKLEKQVEDQVLDVKEKAERKDKKNKELHRLRSDAQEHESNSRNIRERVRILDDYKQFIETVLAKNLEKVAKKDRERIDSLDEDFVNFKEFEDFDDNGKEQPQVGQKDTTFNLTSVQNQEAERLKQTIDNNEMSDEEKADRLLKNFKSVCDFMDVLKRVEEDNLFMIQNTQEIEKDCTEEDHKLEKMKSTFDVQIQQLNTTIKRLEIDTKNLKKKIKIKENFQKNEQLAATKFDEPEELPQTNDQSNKLDQLNKSVSKDKPIEEKSKNIISKKITDVFLLISKPNERMKYGQKGDIDKMLGIENSFDEYIWEFNEFKTKNSVVWNDCNNKWNIFSRDIKIQQREANEAEANKIIELNHEKNRHKKRKHEGRFDKPKTYLTREVKKVETVEQDEDYLDYIRYFT